MQGHLRKVSNSILTGDPDGPGGPRGPIGPYITIKKEKIIISILLCFIIEAQEKS